MVAAAGIDLPRYLCATAREALQYMQHPVGLDGLGEVRVEAGLLGSQAIAGLSVARERRQHDALAMAFAQLGRKHVAIAVRKPDVEDRGVRHARRRRGQRFRAVRTGANGISRELEVASESVARIGVVLDHAEVE